MLSLLKPLLDIPTAYYGALLGVGFCIYYLFEVVKVSSTAYPLLCHFVIVIIQIYYARRIARE